MPPITVTIRPASEADLDAINHVIQAAVMTWPLPERVKSLSLPSYRYTALDLEHLDISVAVDDRRDIIGVAAWEQADAGDTPAGNSALLLHGIYVDPAYHHQGIGRRLFRAVEEASRTQGYDGLLTRAQESANGFFMAQGMQPLPVEDAAHQYANRFWKRVDANPRPAESKK